jgi:hypothetical protein
MIDHEITATSDAAAAGHLQSGDIQAPMPHADGSDGATAHGTTDAVTVPPPNLHRYDQAAYDQAAGVRWHHHDLRNRLANDDGEPLDRTPATTHRTDITIRNAITALNWSRPNARGALALGHGWRTCATCVPLDGPGLPPWQCQRVGATTMRWELRDPWSDAVYCCGTCYDTGGEEYDVWGTSYAQTRPCTSEWPDEVLTALFGPPPPPHHHAGAMGTSVASIHLAAHMDDAAEPGSDDDEDGYRQAELIYNMLQTVTRHANAPTVVRVTVLHLLQAHDLADALAAPVTGLQTAMDATPVAGTHSTPPGSPAAQDQFVSLHCQGRVRVCTLASGRIIAVDRKLIPLLLLKAAFLPRCVLNWLDATITPQSGHLH